MGMPYLSLTADELKNVLLLSVCGVYAYVRDCTVRRYMCCTKGRNPTWIFRVLISGFRIYPLLRNCLLNLCSMATLFIARIYEIYPQIL